MKNCVTEILCPHPESPVEARRSPGIGTAAFGPALTWAHFPDRGRGLVACADVEAGTVLDVAPAVPVQADEGGAVLRQYIFMCQRDDCLSAYSGPVKQAFVFGPMSLCNHSEHPNAGVCFQENEARGLEARLITRRHIAKGEEVTIRYTDCDWYKDSGLF